MPKKPITKAEAEAKVQDAIRVVRAEKTEADKTGGNKVIDAQLAALHHAAAAIANR